MPAVVSRQNKMFSYGGVTKQLDAVRWSSSAAQRSAALHSVEAVESRGWGKLKVGCKCVGEDKKN